MSKFTELSAKEKNTTNGGFSSEQIRNMLDWLKKHLGR